MLHILLSNEIVFIIMHKLIDVHNIRVLYLFQYLYLIHQLFFQFSFGLQVLLLHNLQSALSPGLVMQSQAHLDVAGSSSASFATTQ